MTSAAGEERAHVLYVSYSRIVREAGGFPVVLTPVDDPEIGALVDRLDGLVMTGGGDMDPTLHGAEMHESVYAVDLERGSFEIALAREAAARRLPTLTICRGLQVINVALGGTLIVDIAAREPSALTHRVMGEQSHTGVHEVTIEEATTTAAALGATSLRVDSIHHQAILRVADTLRVTGRAPDGVIEAVEPTDRSWPMWGVQWHPEWLPGEEPSHRIFASLMTAAA